MKVALTKENSKEITPPQDTQSIMKKNPEN